MNELTKILTENIHQRLIGSVNSLIKNPKRNFYLLDKESTIPNIIFDKVEKKDPKTILVIDDLTCEIAREFPNAEVTLALSSYRVPDSDSVLCSIIKDRIERYFSVVKKEIKVVWLKEIYNMKNKFDLIIANPPYGSIGAEITAEIVNNIDFNEYINLLPMSDYAKGNVDIVKHISRINDIEDAFADAAVTTAVAIILKTPVNSISADQLKLSMKDFGILNKFFRKQLNLNYDLPIRQRNFRGMENRFAVAIGRRDASHGHLPYSRNTKEYLFNVGQIDQAEYESRAAERHHGKLTGNLTSDPIFFKTKVEAENYRDFIYSKDGFRFISMIWTTYSTDSSQAYEDCFPRVDWTHPWTVEEILADYGYTPDEIKEVMEDLKNYKYFNK